ncbi:MAG: peptidylprolyl isomerase [Lachnospiraceae bacterium]|nr:peptidylprolyl isomerase [Lachnospiraceae bacterium]
MKKTVPWLLMSLMLFFTGCSFPVSWDPLARPAVSLDADYITEPQARIIALDYKCQFEKYYRELFGEEFWSLELPDGMDYETYVKEYFLFRELSAVLILDDLSAEMGISLNRDETERIEEASEAWFGSLNETEKAFTRASKKDASGILTRYYLAEKTVEKLLEGKNAEISEEESRVCDIQMIRADTLEKAEELYDRISGGESFLSVANNAGEDRLLKLSVARGELVPELDDVVFSMKNTDISEILSVGGRYFIIRMENSRNVLLSMNNRENLLADKRFALWRHVYEEKASASDIRRDSGIWEAIRLNETGEYGSSNLFSYIE